MKMVFGAALAMIFATGSARGADEEATTSCFLVSGKVRCARSESADLASSRKWPTAIGIGPEKSGSSTLDILMSKVPSVIVGRKKGPNDEDTFELNWLIRPQNIKLGLANYSEYFIVDDPGNHEAKKVAYEKSPQYSSHSVVPYRARSFVKDLKLVFTTRDMLELDASLYLYLQVDKANVSYDFWVNERIKAFARMMECRRDQFEKLMIPGSDGTKLTIDALHDSTHFSWQAASLVESAIFETCQNGAVSTFPKRSFSVPMANIFLPLSIKRWAHAFPADQIHCVDIKERTEDPQTSLDNFFDFVELPRVDLEFSIKKSNNVAEHAESPFDRIVQSQLDMASRDGQGTQNKDMAEAIVKRLQQEITNTAKMYVTCEDVEKFHSVCGYRPFGYDWC